MQMLMQWLAGLQMLIRVCLCSAKHGFAGVPSSFSIVGNQAHWPGLGCLGSCAAARKCWRVIHEDRDEIWMPAWMDGKTRIPWPKMCRGLIEEGDYLSLLASSSSRLRRILIARDGMRVAADAWHIAPAIAKQGLLGESLSAAAPDCSQHCRHKG